MIDIDARTLWLLTVASQGLYAAALGLVWSVRRTEPALAYWALASLCTALACLGISQRGAAPDWASIVLANFGLGLAISLRWAGARHFAGQPLHPLGYLGMPLLILVLFALRQPLDLDVADRVVIAAGIGVGYTGLMVLDCLRALRDEPLMMRRLFMAVSLGALLVQGARVIDALVAGVNSNFLNQTTLQAGLILVFLGIYALFDLCAFMMVFERHEARLTRAATLDALTSLLNRAGFNQLAGRQLQRSRHGQTPASVLVMDLDHFKHINDGYGHEAGDAVLRAFAQSARAALRPTDLLARPGGEEFWALLPDTDLAEAQRVAQRVCDQFRAVRVAHEGRQISATVSVGAAGMSADGEPLQAALVRADRALYQAKDQGRDRVVAAGSEKPAFR